MNRHEVTRLAGFAQPSARCDRLSAANPAAVLVESARTCLATRLEWKVTRRVNRRRLLGGGTASLLAALSYRLAGVAATHHNGQGTPCVVSEQCQPNCLCCGGQCRCCAARRRVRVDGQGFCVCCTRRGPRWRRCNRA